MPLFDDAAGQRIAARIAEVERQTAGELVVMTVGRSSDYAGSRALLSAGLPLMVGLIASFVTPALPARSLLAALAVLGALVYWLSGTAPLVGRLAPQRLVEAACQKRAMLAFLERGVHRTRDGSGVLIFLSVAERRAVVLGDHGVYARFGEASWQPLVQRLVAALRAGQAEAGLLAAIDELGSLLARDFPRRPGDTNELPDEVVERNR